MRKGKYMRNRFYTERNSTKKRKQMIEEKRMAFHTQPVFPVRKKDPGMSTERHPQQPALGAFLGAVLKLQSAAFVSLFQICLEYDEGTYVFTKPLK